jgi:hypothetical protein
VAKTQVKTTVNKRAPEVVPPPREDATEVLGTGNLEQVREILFGAQSRGVDKRLARLEEDLPRRLAEIRDELKRGLGALEAYARGEIDALNERLAVDARERAKAHEELRAKLDETAKAVRKEHADLADRSAAAQRELRQQLLDQAKRIDEDLQRRTEELAAALVRAVDELRAEKADRKALAGILHEVAMRLTDGISLPLGEDAKL